MHALVAARGAREGLWLEQIYCLTLSPSFEANIFIIVGGCERRTMSNTFLQDHYLVGALSAKIEKIIAPSEKFAEILNLK